MATLETIQNILQERGWTVQDFATMLGGLSKATGSKIINGNQTPSLDQAELMSQMLDLPLEEIVDAYLQETKKNEDFKKQQQLIDLYRSVPVSAMLKHNWVQVRDKKDVKQILQAFASIKERYGTAGALAKKTNPEDVTFTPTQEAWMLQVRRLADNMDVAKPYSSENFDELLEKLKELYSQNEDFDAQELFALLSDHGIKLVFVECKGSKIDGVCMWMNDMPIIGMTLRFDRLDNFWFVLIHELAHVKQGPQAQPSLTDDIFAVAKQEDEANKFAQEFCCPKKLIESFLDDSILTNQSVEAFAKEHNLNTSAVAGQIRYRLNRYNILGRLIKPIRNHLLEAAPCVDGWGRFPRL